MITTLKLSLVGWLINLVKWKSIANESTAVWHFSIQFKLKSPTIIISQLLREGTLETWPLEQRNCKCHKEWAERGVTRESRQMNSSWTAQLCQLPGRGLCQACEAAAPSHGCSSTPLPREAGIHFLPCRPVESSSPSLLQRRVCGERWLLLFVFNSLKFGLWMSCLFILSYEC